MWQSVLLPLLITVVGELLVAIILGIARRNSARARAFWQQHWPSVVLAAIVLPLLIQIEWSLFHISRSSGLSTSTATSAPTTAQLAAPDQPAPTASNAQGEQPTTGSIAAPTVAEAPTTQIEMPTIAAVPASANTPACSDPGDTELLPAPWTLSADGGNADEPTPPYPSLPAGVLQDKDVLAIQLNLQGGVFEEGVRKDASAIVLDQGGHWFVASVLTHGAVNASSDNQTIFIPLSDFEELDDTGHPDGKRLDLTKPIGPLHARFWSAQDFSVQVTSIVGCNSKPGV